MKRSNTKIDLPEPIATHSRETLRNAAGSESDSLLTETQAAGHLNIRPGTLACWRATKRYPLPYVKIGRSVRYRRSALEAFASSREQGADESSEGGAA